MKNETYQTEQSLENAPRSATNLLSNSGHVAWFKLLFYLVRLWHWSILHPTQAMSPRVSILKGPPPKESQKSLKLFAVDLGRRVDMGYIWLVEMQL